MALLRLQCFPSTQQLSSPISLHISFKPSTTTFHSPPSPSPSPSLSLSSSSSLSHLSHLIPIKTRRAGLFLSHVSSTTEAQSTTVETPVLENSGTAAEQVQVEAPSSTVETPVLENSSNAEQVQVEEDESSRTKLIALNVPSTCTTDDIRPLFEKYGTVLKVEFSMYNKNRNRGLAFITMSSHEEAVAALTNLDLYEFDGRVLKLDWAKPRKKNPPTPYQAPSLYVTNLPFQARAKDLREFFNADKGNVVSARIMFDEKRRSRGFGFVFFNTQEDAEAALSDFQGKMFMGRTIRVSHKKRFPKQETKATIQAENSSVESNTSTPEPDKADEDV